MDKSKLPNIALLKQASAQAKKMGVAESPITYSESGFKCLYAWEINNSMQFDWAKRTLTKMDRDFIFGVGLMNTERGLIEASAVDMLEVMDTDSFDELADLRDGRQYELHGLTKFGDDDFVFDPAVHQMAAIVLYRKHI